MPKNYSVNPYPYTQPPQNESNNPPQSRPDLRYRQNDDHTYYLNQRQKQSEVSRLPAVPAIMENIEPYDIVADLQKQKADITIAQLVGLRTGQVKPVT